jgi:hypothetical protein
VGQAAVLEVRAAAALGVVVAAAVVAVEVARVEVLSTVGLLIAPGGLAVTAEVVVMVVLAVREVTAVPAVWAEEVAVPLS